MHRSHAQLRIVCCVVVAACACTTASATPLAIYHLADPTSTDGWRWMFAPRVAPADPDAVVVEQVHAMPEPATAAPVLSLGAGDGLGTRLRYNELRIAEHTPAPEQNGAEREAPASPPSRD